MEIKSLLVNSRFLEQKTKIPKVVDNGIDYVLWDLPDDEFKQALRLNKETFEIVLNEIRYHEIFHNNSRNKQAAVKIQLAVALER